MGLSRRPVLASAIATGSALLGGCLDRVLSDGGTGTDPQTELLVLAGGDTDGGSLHAATTLVQYTPDSSDGWFERDFEYSPADGRITDAVSFRDGTVVVTADQTGYRPSADRAHLRRLNDAGTLQATATVDGVPSIASNGDRIVAVSSHGAWVFESDLETAGSASIEGDRLRKHMEDVRIHDDVAYVVDDQVFPRYLFRIDVDDPTQPTLIEAVPILGTNHTLGQQWLEPANDRWGVLQSSSTRAGSRQRVLTTPMSGVETDDDEDSLSFDDLPVPTRDTDAVGGETVYEDQRGTDLSQGTPIHDVASSPPLWASLTDDDGDRVIAPFTIDPAGDSRFHVGESIAIGAPARVATTATHCYALTTGDGATELLVRDIEAGETVLHRELPVESPSALRLGRS